MSSHKWLRPHPFSNLCSPPPCPSDTDLSLLKGTCCASGPSLTSRMSVKRTPMWPPDPPDELGACASVSALCTGEPAGSPWPSAKGVGSVLCDVTPSLGTNYPGHVSLALTCGLFVTRILCLWCLWVPPGQQLHTSTSQASSEVFRGRTSTSSPTL